MTFSAIADEPAWEAVNDGVMGGLSRGGAEVVDGQLRFAGWLALANNGGFASVRATVRQGALVGATTMILRLQGDGRTYQLRLATDARVAGSRVSYRAEFPTVAGQWAEVRIPLATLVPSRRGEQLDGPPLNLATVEEIGLLLGDSREGPFLLLVDWIRVE